MSTRQKVTTFIQKNRFKEIIEDSRRHVRELLRTEQIGGGQFVEKMISIERFERQYLEMVEEAISNERSALFIKCMAISMLVVALPLLVFVLVRYWI